jgi:hypothetical protein
MQRGAARRETDALRANACHQENVVATMMPNTRPSAMPVSRP